MSYKKSICVFCGSSKGILPSYEEQAQEIGKFLLKEQFRLVYGGGKVGLMGVVANEVMQGGGEAIGVIPNFLVEMEVAHLGLTKLMQVTSMHERKKLMSEMADAFVILPGGIGTFEEFFEILTWRQLRLHHKPIALLNVGHYYDALIQFLDHAVSQKFLRQETRDFILIADNANTLMEQLKQALALDTPEDLDSEKI